MYLKSNFLNSTRFFFAPDKEGDEDTRTPAEKERDTINVSGSTDDKEEDKEDKNGDDTNDNEDSTDDDEENEEEETDEEDKEDKVDKEETADEKAARIDKEKEERREARVQKRIDKAVARAKAAETERDELKAKLAEKPVEGLTEEEVERRAEAKAAERLKAKELETNQKTFEKNIDALEVDARKHDKKFDANVAKLVDEVGLVPAPLIMILSELDNKNGGAVLAHLAKNIDEAEDIYDLSERQMTQRLIRLSDKLKAEAKPVRSRVPNPPENLDRTPRQATTTINDNTSMEDFVKIRARQEAEKRKARGY